MRNLRLALRTISRTPIVTAIAVLSLGLGIGSNAAIYSIFYRVVRQELAVPGADRLVNFSAPGPKNGGVSCSQAGSCDDVFSYPMFRDLQRAHVRSLSSIAGHRDLGANVSYEQRSFATNGLLVSGSYFPTLRVRPAIGRLLSAGDDDKGAPPVVVLSHWFWESKLGADSSALGRRLSVNGKSATIIGVTPPDFDGTTVGSRPAFYAALAAGPTLGNGIEREIDDRRSYYIYAFGRLAPDATIEQVRRDINAVYRPIIHDVEAPLQKGMRESEKQPFLAKVVTVQPGSHGQSSLQKDTSGPLFMLFAITGLVLLIACANIANLLMTRAANREMEMAVRLSLGATRRQLLSQLLTESLTLAFIGGVVSLVFAAWTLRAMSALLPPEINETLPLALNWAAVGFAGVLSLVTGIAFGLFPALHGTRPDLVTSLRNNSGKLAGGRASRRLRTSLATAQIALAMALLMSAGLFLKSLWNVSRVNLGIRVEHLVTFSLNPQQNGYDSVHTRALFARVEDELAGLPGTTAVTSALVPLIAGSNWNMGLRVQGFQSDPNNRPQSSFNGVGAGFFHAIGVPLLAGRDFNSADDIGRPKVAIVNEAFARKFNLGANPVGKRMATRVADTLPLDIEIVGLVPDTKYARVKDAVPPVFFIPHRQESNVGQMNFYVRTSGDPAVMLRAVTSVVQRVDPMLPVEHIQTMPEVIKQNTFLDRMLSTLSASFGALATLLAAIGLYGVLAYSVAQRTREIGIRMALGAHATQVRGMVLAQVGRMVLIGGIIGIAGALALGRAAQSMLYEMSSLDPIVMAASVILLALVALAAGYVPALRASRVDPMQALRYE